MRIDKYLYEYGYCSSREKAKTLIAQKRVFINNITILKPSLELDENINHDIQINTDEFFVSRGGEKLFFYLKDSNIICKNKKILDVGSSTGGFAQVLLKNNAKSITCVDVGFNQLDIALRENPKIKLFEKCDIRDFKTQEKFDLVTCDVSFISLSKILDYLYVYSNEFLLLFKPQFEVGKDTKRSKKGVILDKKATQKRMQEFIKELENKNLKIKSIKKSLIKGKEGNEEFFFHITKC